MRRHNQKMLAAIDDLISTYQNYGKKYMLFKLNNIINRNKLKLFEVVILQDVLISTMKNKNILFS